MKAPAHYLRFARAVIVAATAGCQIVPPPGTDAAADATLLAQDGSNDADASVPSIDALDAPTIAFDAAPLDACHCYDPLEDSGAADVSYCVPFSHAWLNMSCGTVSGPLDPPELPT